MLNSSARIYLKVRPKGVDKMRRNGVILISDVLPVLEKKVVRIDPKELRNELEKLRDTPVLADIVVKTGVKEYGFPADAKERRM